MHRYFQFSGCGLDQKAAVHGPALHTASESGTAFAGPAGPSMSLLLITVNATSCKHKAHYRETVLVSRASPTYSKGERGSGE